jgi:hypothetical protein
VPAISVATPFCFSAHTPVEQLIGRDDLAAELGTEHALRIGEGLDDVDHEDRRALAETDPQAEAAFAEKLRVSVAFERISHCSLRIAGRRVRLPARVVQ